jgi:hypothetical protein
MAVVLCQAALLAAAAMTSSEDINTFISSRMLHFEDLRSANGHVRTYGLEWWAGAPAHLKLKLQSPLLTPKRLPLRHLGSEQWSRS